MNDEILRLIIRLKLKAADSIIDFLPEAAQKQAMNLKASFIKVASEVLNEHMDKIAVKNNSNKRNGVESISID